jgi:hypothetical protein
MLAWTMAGELPKLPLADGLELVLLESDVEPARFARAVPRPHARLCSERQLSTRGGAVCTSRLERPAGAGRGSVVQSLAAVCETHGLGREVQVLQTWLSRRGRS